MDKKKFVGDIPSIESAISSEPVEISLGRLTVGQTIVTLGKMEGQIKNLIDSFNAVKEASSPQNVGEDLKQLVKFAGAIVANAERLLEGNR